MWTVNWLRQQLSNRAPAAPLPQRHFFFLSCHDFTSGDVPPCDISTSIFHPTAAMSAFLPTPSLQRPCTPHRPHRLCPQLSAAPPNATPALPDWRAFRAALTRSPSAPPRAPPTKWAHRQPHVEVGSTLISNAHHTWPPAFAHLNRAVILITDVSSVGPTGLLLNRPTHLRVRNHAAVLGRVGREFNDNIVHLGGDCSTGSLEVLHSVPPDVCSGAQTIVPGVHRAGLNACRELVRAGMSPHEFRFFVAYSRWTWDSFWAEMADGAWSIVSCSPDLIVGGNGETLWHDVMSAL